MWARLCQLGAGDGVQPASVYLQQGEADRVEEDEGDRGHQVDVLQVLRVALLVQRFHWGTGG